MLFAPPEAVSREFNIRERTGLKQLLQKKSELQKRQGAKRTSPAIADATIASNLPSSLSWGTQQQVPSSMNIFYSGLNFCSGGQVDGKRVHLKKLQIFLLSISLATLSHIWNQLYIHACMTSYFNKLLEMGLRSCKNRLFFPLAFILYLLTQIFHNLWKGKQLIWDWEDMEKATSSWDTLGTAFNGLARGRFLYVWVHTGSMQPILILDR